MLATTGTHDLVGPACETDAAGRPVHYHLAYRDSARLVAPIRPYARRQDIERAVSIIEASHGPGAANIRVKAGTVRQCKCRN